MSPRYTTLYEYQNSSHTELPLDCISHAGLDGALEDKAEKLYVSGAAYESPHPSFYNYLTVDLTLLKEMSQALADLLGLTLPVSLKNEGLVADKL